MARCVSPAGSLPSPASELKDAVGYLEVKSAKNLSSDVAPVAFNDKPALALDQLPPKAYARLAEVVDRPPLPNGLTEDQPLGQHESDGEGVGLGLLEAAARLG